MDNKIVTVSIPEDLYNKIEEEGRGSERKISTHIRFILKERYENQEMDTSISD